MKIRSNLRFSLSFLLILAMLSPISVLAMGDGKKHFSIGMKFEDQEAWDKAAEEFALAVSDNPKNPEYKLHLQRALFQASQMYIKKGTELAKEKDYVGGYNAFRKAYAYDPTNELAQSEMERMVRLQQGVTPGADVQESGGGLKLVQTSYKKTAAPLPQKLEKLRDVPFPGGVDLQFIIKELAKDLDLNVLFDSQSPAFRSARQVKIDLRGVSAAQALDYIFLQESLFFQKVGPRTILVSDSTRRPIFQQLVLRTFYLSNADPTKIKPLIQQAIPPQPGRTQTIVMDDAATNSITIRDTEENIRLIGRLIQSLDKDRAEVVMDVAIYEVNKSDLLQFGNQIGVGGANSTLTNLGGVTFGAQRFGNTGKISLPTTVGDALGLAIGLPSSSIIALQNKSNTKLLASTQIHAFNNEDSTARIGQRVPVRTAQVQTGNAVGGGGIVSDIINYEQVGLTLKFKPLVFPNQDVQVVMDIESKDVAGTSGVGDANPIFTERRITGTARVENNKTLLLASAGQSVESKGRTGLPLLGLIPVLGRLFSAPTRDNRQIDIVIAITPRVIRAPAILPEDEVERSTGSQATPTNSSLVAMIMQDEEDEQIAAARRSPTNASVQLPDQPSDTPNYVRTSAVEPQVQNNSTATTAAPNTIEPGALKPIDTSASTLDLKKTSDTSVSQPPVVEQPRATLQPTDDSTPAATTAPKATLRFANELPTMKVGDKVRVPIVIDGSAAFRSATLGLTFDDKKFAIRSVAFGDVFGAKVANTSVIPFLNQNGKMYVTLSPSEVAMQGNNGVIAYIEVEALSQGKLEIGFDRQTMTVLTPEGKNFSILF
jgi:general secretion pathway protein D